MIIVYLIDGRLHTKSIMVYRGALESISEDAVYLLMRTHGIACSLVHNPLLYCTSHKPDLPFRAPCTHSHSYLVIVIGIGIGIGIGIKHQGVQRRKNKRVEAKVNQHKNLQALLLILIGIMRIMHAPRPLASPPAFPFSTLGHHIYTLSQHST
ncbi:hypothetical protein F4819DRAFT_345353 [Hypoxylon fuscum]|nr:hypothetical protein F4819DRAFT_345353 [Hypoxylon fuscum]